MYYFYYLVLRCSSDLCEAHLDHSAALTQTLRALAATAELVASGASHYIIFKKHLGAMLFTQSTSKNINIFEA